MSILSTVKKGYLYMKTSTGYLKLLPRTLASLVSLDNGNSVETEISTIKTNATNLSNTVSGIKTKTDALKNGANATVANNATTTASGYVLDARMGKTLQDSINTLNSTSVTKLDTNYIKFVNGLIIQWGTGKLPSTAEGGQGYSTITLPTSYTTKDFIVVACAQYPGTANPAFMVSTAIRDASTIYVYGRTGDLSIIRGAECRWIAFGY